VCGQHSHNLTISFFFVSRQPQSFNMLSFIYGKPVMSFVKPISAVNDKAINYFEVHNTNKIISC